MHLPRTFLLSVSDGVRSITGLPNIRSTGTDTSHHLIIEYLRRKATTHPGLTYRQVDVP